MQSRAKIWYKSKKKMERDCRPSQRYQRCIDVAVTHDNGSKTSDYPCLSYQLPFPYYKSLEIC